MQKIVADLQNVLKQTCVSVEPIGEVDENGASWLCEMDNDICCIVSCEDNAEDFDIPTVSIAISIGDISKLTKNDLFELLSMNDSFWRATLTTKRIGKSWMLFLQYKVMAESFKMEEAEFLGCIDHLVSQQQMFMG